MRKGTKSIALFKIFFVGLLMFPTVWMLLDGGTLLENWEKRELATFPSFADSVEQFPKAYEKYLNDHFGGRNELVFATNFFKASALKSSHTDDVMIGKEGWRFLNKRHMISDYRGIARFDNDQLAAIQYRFELMDSIVNSYGGKFIVVVAPNKQSIYPEYLPWHMQKLNDTTRLDQLTAYMAKNSEVQFLNLKTALMRRKEETKVYFTTDTHWTSLGASAGFVALMKALYGPDVKFHENSNPVVRIDSVSGDLNGMLGFSGLFKERLEVVSFEDEEPLAYSEESYSKSKYLKAVNKKGKRESILFYNDSFGRSLRDFLYHRYSTTYVLKNKQIDLPVIAKEKPDVVVFEIVERQLAFFPNCKIVR